MRGPGDIYRVMVLGGGAAGVAAALAAARGGARVALVRRSPGATAMSSGALDLAADPTERPGSPWAGRPPLAALYDLQLRLDPDHPLGVAGLDSAEAFTLLRAACEALPLLQISQPDQPARVLPTDMGTFKSTSGSARWAAGGHLPDLADQRLGVVGFRGYPLFRPHHLARSYVHFAAAGGIKLEAIPLEVELLRRRGEELMPPTALALQVERPERLSSLLEQLGREAKRLELTRLLLPPVMGLHGWSDVLEQVSAVLPAAEMLASPPSVPGLRLQHALERALSEAGVAVVRGKVTALQRGGASGSWGATLADERRVEAERLVLATGKFIGGGLAHRRRLREPLLGLPVWIDDDGPNPRYPGGKMSRRVQGPHPLFRAGVRVDSALHPLDAHGQRAHDTLSAAGSVVGGYDYIGGRCGLGTALITGWLAGAQAAGGGTP